MADIKRKQKIQVVIKNKWKIFVELLVVLFSIGILAVALLLIWISSLKLPDFNTIASRQLESTTKIYDRTGKTLLFAFREKIRRTEVQLKDISPNLIKSTVAIEDVNFYQHSGLSIRGISRALYTNLTTDKQQGGSTITQQVVKNALLTNEKTLERKVKEAILAIKLEQTLSKDQIMLMYLNDAPYGGDINGAEEASLYYFNKHARDLNLVESAYLAAIPKNPNLYNPYGNNTDKLEERKNVVLLRMLETGQINQEEYTRARQEKITFVKKEDNNSKAYHFVFYIKDYLQKKFGDNFDTLGLSVTTTLDYDLQKDVEELAKNYINNYIAVQQKKNKKVNLSQTNTAVVVLDAKTDQILSMIGSRDYNDEKIDGKFNVATALRQPGSSIKPIVYGALFEEGMDPEAYVFDTPTEFNPDCAPANGLRRDPPCYSPQNYDDSFWGPISLRDALANSKNIPAVKVLYTAGIQNVATFAKKLGITSLTNPSRYGLSLVLGGAEVSLLEMTGAYSVYSQNGVYRKPTGVLEIKDKNGKILEQYKDNGYNVIDSSVAGKINSILTDNNARARTFGYSSPLYVSDEVAVKTGTTNSYRDGWILGYSSKNVVGAWIGKNDNTPLGDTAAAVSIAPMWNQIFKKIIAKNGTGELDKNYTVNQDLAGLKCVSGQPQDLLQTAVYSGMFSNINNTDPQLSRWVHSSSYCQPSVVEQIIESTGSSTASPGTPGGAPTTSGDGSIQVQSTSFTPQIQTNPNNPTQTTVPQNTTTPPQP